MNKVIWVPEKVFIEGVCNHPEMPQGKTIDDICSVLYSNGMLVRNNVIGGWRHWDNGCPEKGAYYLLKPLTLESKEESNFTP